MNKRILLSVVLLFFAGISVAGDIQHRKKDVLKRYYNHYSKTESQSLRNKINWAFTALSLSSDDSITEKANSVIYESLKPLDGIFTKVEEGELGQGAIYDIYWEIVVLSRIVNSSKLSLKLDKQTDQAIKKVLWDFVKNHDNLDSEDVDYSDLTQVYKSDNHDMIHRGLFILTAQSLKNDPKWSSVKYKDGKNPQEKYQWWSDNLMDYFRFRASTGVNIEFGSAGYAAVYLQPIFNIHDCCEDENLRKQAGKFLDLYFADASQEVLNGIRGGAKVRMYKTNVSYDYIADKLVYYNYILTGKPEGFDDLVPPSCLVAAQSDYRLPEVVHSLMVSPEKKGSYSYVSSRLGQGTYDIVDHPDDGYSAAPVYNLELPSAMRRYTYSTPSYILGTFTIDETKRYTLLNSQNQWMGLVTSANEQSRIVFGLTPSSANDPRTGYRELQSVQYENCAIFRKQLASTNATLMRLYASDDFEMTDFSKKLKIRQIEMVSAGLKKKGLSDGLLVFENEKVYVAVILMDKQAKIDYSIEKTSHGPGRFVTFANPDIYLITEVTEKEKYKTLDSFVEYIAANKFFFEKNSDELVYESKKTDCRLKMFAEISLPEVNGKPVDLHPEMVYNSPWLKSIYESGVVTVKGIDNTELVLDFNHHLKQDKKEILIDERGGEPFISREMVIDNVWSGHPVNFFLLTEGDRQYAAYYNADRDMTVAMRELDSNEWIKSHPHTGFNEPPIGLSAPASTKLGWDSHNYVTMALDKEGFLHLSGNMHGGKLTYFRSKNPYDVSSFEHIEKMTGENESACTYPVFNKNAKDDLIFTYRDGGSGRGTQIYNIYSVESQSWSRLLDTPLVDGQGTRSAYIIGPKLGPDGWYHMSWVWRDTGCCSTNHDLSYAKSPDLIEWYTVSDKRIKLPITFETKGVIVDPVPVKGGIINGNGKIGFDIEQRPVLTYHKFDTNGFTQAYASRFQDSEWNIKKLTEWDYRWDFSGHGSIIFEINVGEMNLRNDGFMELYYKHKSKHGYWLIDNNLCIAGEVMKAKEVPNSLNKVKSKFPNMQIRRAVDKKDEVFYLMQWETLGHNRDMPREGKLPEPSDLIMYEILYK